MDHKADGFTFIELIIALSIVSILLAYGVPNYRAFKQNQAMTQSINRLAATINYARNQSIIRAEHIILCPSQSFTACDGGSNWHGGWVVYIDQNRNRLFDVDDEMLLNEVAMPADLLAQSSSHRSKVRFNSLGASPGSNVSIRFCDQRGATSGKGVIISNVGRPRVAQNIESCG